MVKPIYFDELGAASTLCTGLSKKVLLSFHSLTLITMATAKFKDASPYKTMMTIPPEDYLYKEFTEDLGLKSSARDDRIVKVALFGMGRAGTLHMSSICNSRRVKLIYVVDDVESNWQKAKKYWHLEGVTFLSSKQADKVYNDASIDAVMVATPTYTHEEIVTRCLTSGKAVFCEKPIAENRENTIKCYEVAKRVGKPLFCAFNRRFDPSYGAVRERVRKGEVGHVQLIKTVSRDSPLPCIDYLEVSGGIFHDCLVHDIDTMTWILGEYPIKVSSQATANIPEIKAINDFDTVVVTLQFPSGTIGMIDLSRFSCYGYDMRLEVFGPKGMVHANNEQPIHCVTTHYGLDGINAPPIWFSFPSRFRLGYRNEFNHFIDVVLGKTEPSVRPVEPLAVSKIATACEESARTGRMIELKWAPNEMPPTN